MLPKGKTLNVINLDTSISLLLQITLETIRRDLARAKAKGFSIGFKLVRGAYMDQVRALFIPYLTFSLSFNQSTYERKACILTFRNENAQWNWIRTIRFIQILQQRLSAIIKHLKKSLTMQKVILINFMFSLPVTMKIRWNLLFERRFCHFCTRLHQTNLLDAF